VVTSIVAGGTSTTGAKDTNLSERSVSIANGAVALMTEAAKAGIEDNEEMY